MQIVFAILVAIHGLITLASGLGSASNPKGIAVPGVSWYQTALGQSWVLPSNMAGLGGLLWVVAGVGLVATAAAIIGIAIPTNAWPMLATGSAIVGLIAVALFFHPYYAVAIVVNIAIIAAATVFRSTAQNLLGI